MDDRAEIAWLEAQQSLSHDEYAGREPVPDYWDAALRDDDRRRQQKAENARLQQGTAPPLAPSMTVKQMIDDAVWIADGSQVAFISNPVQVLTFNDFAGLTASCSTEVDGSNGKPRNVPNAILWKNAVDRKTVASRTFHAGAAAICVDPDGRVAINSWRSIERRPESRDVSPFTEHVAYLIADPVERAVFLDWLAHIEQFPGILPHYGWLHIAKKTGTGRNWLASVLSRLWRGYVAPNVDLPSLLSSQFNGQLAGRVLAIVDEVQEGGGENPYRNMNRLKSIVNAEQRDVNPKYGRQYREHNSCRWLVFSNHDNALPINDTDRRWRVVRHEGAPRPAEYYARLYALLADDEFVNAIGVWLRSRDLGRFNPGERPPMNDAKRAAVDASKSPIVQNAEHLVDLWPVDVMTNRDIAKALSDRDPPYEEPTPAMRRALNDLGAVIASKLFTVRGMRGRGWVLRNIEKWANASGAELGAEAARVSGDVFQVLQDAQDGEDQPF